MLPPKKDDLEVEPQIRQLMKKSLINHLKCFIPIGSMYCIFTYTYHKFKPNVGKYFIHGASGIFEVTPNFRGRRVQEKLSSAMYFDCQGQGCRVVWGAMVQPVIGNPYGYIYIYINQCHGGHHHPLL